LIVTFFYWFFFLIFCCFTLFAPGWLAAQGLDGNATITDSHPG